MQNRLGFSLIGKIAFMAFFAISTAVMPAAAQNSSYKAPRTADGKADLNGIWQAMNTANWDIQAHAAAAGPVASLAADFAVPPGPGVVEGNEIPYLPAMAGKEETELRTTVQRRSRSQMLPAGRAPGDLHAVSVPDHPVARKTS